MHQDRIRFLGRQHLLQPVQDGGRDIGQPLTGSHDLQIVMRCDPEEIGHLAQHFGMLACDADPAFQIGSALDRADHRRHLDCLGTGPEY